MHPFRVISRTLCLLLALLLLPSCTLNRATVQPTPFLQKGGKRLTLNQLLALVEERERAMRGFKALVQISTQEKRNPGESLTGSLFFESGGAWRFRGFDLIGRTVVDLLITREGFQIFLPRQGEHFMGTLDQIQPLHFNSGLPSPRHLLTLMNSLGPLFLEPLEIPMLEEQSDRYLLYLLLLQGSQASLKRKIWFEGEHLDLQREELFDSDGRLETVLSFEGHRDVAGFRRPHRVTAQEGERTVTLTFEEIEMNPLFGTEDFRLTESGTRP